MCPLDNVKPGRLAATMRKYFPFAITGVLGVDRDHDALRTVFLGRVGDELRIGDRSAIDTDLVSACIEQTTYIVDRAHAAAHCQWNEYLGCHSFDNMQNQIAAVGGCRDIEKSDFVRTLLIVAARDFHRVASIAQLNEVYALDHATRGHVEAGDNTFGQCHGYSSGCSSKPLNTSARSCARRKSSVPS